MYYKIRRYSHDLFLSFTQLYISSGTQTTIQGPFQQGSTTISALPEDCLSPVDWQDIVFTIGVPIAAGFGLLLLLASLQDLWQAYKVRNSI